MTDLEISKALALAIGWIENKLDENGCNDSDIAVFGDGEIPESDEVKVWTGTRWRTFDYRDPAVIWPIAKACEGFPTKGNDGLWSVSWFGPSADTPEKAVALAVIGGEA